METKRQDYICDGCGLESHVTYRDDEGAWAVVQKIGDDHRHWSPECKRSVRELRLSEGGARTHGALRRPPADGASS